MKTDETHILDNKYVLFQCRLPTLKPRLLYHVTRNKMIIYFLFVGGTFVVQQWPSINGETLNGRSETKRKPSQLLSCKMLSKYRKCLSAILSKISSNMVNMVLKHLAI